MKIFNHITNDGFGFGSCEDFLDRPPITQMNVFDLWTDENGVRQYANGFYPSYFVGYNSNFSVDYTRNCCCSSDKMVG